MRFTLVWAFLALAAVAAAQPVVPAPPQSDQIIIDAQTPGSADPNDRIRYTVIISNTGDAPANDVQLNAMIDPNTTLVPGSFKTSPMAANDAFATTGNLGISVPAPGLKSNDYDNNLAAATLSCGACMSANGGTVVVNNDGSFTYTPPPGFTGMDNFSYTMTDSDPVGAPVPDADDATVTITVSNLIWFIDNSLVPVGNGTLAAPFNSLAAFNANSAASGDVVYIAHTGTDYTDGIVLQGGERLFGEGHSGGLNLADVLPFMLAPNSPALPAIGGSRPVITNASGNGISLASANAIRGVEVGATMGAKISGAMFGTLILGNTTTPDVLLSGNGQAFNLMVGSFDVTSQVISVASVNSAGQGILLQSVGGTVGFGSTSITGSAMQGISISNSSVNVNFGNTNIAMSGGTGVHLQTNTGNLTFADLDIAPNAGQRALFAVDNTGTVTVTSGTVVASMATGVEITGAGGATPVNMVFTSITTNGGTNGIFLNNVSGTFNGGTGSLAGATGTGFLIQNGTAAITYSGGINTSGAFAVDIDNHDSGDITFQTGAITNSNMGIRVQNCNGGTKAFAGGTKTLNTGANKGVTLTNNAGASINFTGGGLVITTTTGIGFDATGGATGVTVTGAGNTISSVSATALNVANTTIGMGNFIFQSISSGNNTVDADPANGIVLNTTGALGGLMVTGTGTTDGSGGVIQNITNRGISVTSSINLSLKNMTLTNANLTDAAPCDATDNSGCNAAIHLNTVTSAILDNIDINTTEQQGINLREVSGFQLLNSTTQNTGAGMDTEEAGLYAINLFGTCAITNSSLTLPAERAAVIYNTSKMMALTVTSSTFGMNQAMPLGADALEISSFGASNTTLDIVNSTFVQPKTNGLQVITEGTSFSSVDITGSTFDPGMGLAAAIDLVTNGTGDMDFNIVNNPMIEGAGINIVNVFAFPNSTFEGRITGNTVVNNGGSGAGIRVVNQGNGNSIVAIQNNTVTGANDYGITVGANSGSGRLDATVADNTVTIASMGFYAIQAVAGVSASIFTNDVCANVANNATTAAAGALGNFQARAATATHEILLQGIGPTVSANWNANGNTPMDPPAIISQSGTGTFTFGAMCATPSNPNP